MKKITPLLLIALLLCTLSSLAQKVAIVGINHTTPDGLAIVALEDLSTGETFYYTDKEYDAATNSFVDQEVVVEITLTAAIAKGELITISETSSDVLSFSCSSGCTGTATVIDAANTNFAISSQGEGHYLYADSDSDPTNGVTEVYCVIYTGSGEIVPSVNGGPIPTNEDPSSDFPNAIVVDGFPNAAPDFMEFNPALRSGAVSKSDLEDPNNWNHGQTNALPSQTPFDDIDAAVDITLPTISSLTPINGATDIAVDANLVVEFNEDVKAVPGNNIIILANLVPVVTIPIDDSQVTIVGSTLTINPTADLPPDASISIGIPNGGLEDFAGNDFGGIDPTTGWVFTTAVPVDNTPPVITSCPEPIVNDSFASNDECGDFVTWEPPTATDNLPGVTLTSNYMPGDLFPFGTTEVTYTATDTAGNHASCSFMVTVNDANAPAPVCINGLTVILDGVTGEQTILATDFIASPITDACGPVTYTISRATVDANSDVRSTSLTLNCDDEETTLIRVWAEDVNGNSDYCETYILVDKSQFMCPAPLIVDLELEMRVDNLTPVVGTKINFTLTLTNKGPGSATGVTVKSLFPSGYSATGAGVVNGGTYHFAPRGEWEFVSPILPGATAKLTLEAIVNPSGDYLNLAEVIALDEIDIDSFPGNGVDTNGDGNLIDDPGDEDDGDAETVTPIDNIPPVAVCKDIMVQLDPNGKATVSVTDIDGGSSDSEGSVTYGIQRRVARIFDQNATPDAIFGSGNANGGFTVNQTGAVELGLRAKVRYPSPQNTFNSNGDGTYSHLAGAGTPASRALWNFEWSVNTDPTGTAGTKLDGLTYEMGMDFDPSLGTDYFVFDPISQPVADHAIGDNMTANGGGTTATDPAVYAGLLAANNVAQNSWNLDFFNELAGKVFDPTVDGTYEVYLKAFDGSGARVGETKITVVVGNGGAPGMLPQSIDFTNADIGTNIVELIVVDAAGNTAICTSTVTVKSACEVEIGTQPMDAEICAGDPLSFDVTATGTGSLSYQWQVDTGSGFADLGAPSASSQLNFASMEIGGNGNRYRAIVTSDNGTPNDARDDCSATSEAATLTVNPLPMVEITGSDSYCYNGNGVVLDAGAGYSSYLWSPGGETTQTITAIEGSYTVQVTNALQCAATSEVFMVTKNEALACNITQDVLTTDHLTQDGVATVNVTGGTGQFTYLWDNGETTQTATTLTYGMHSVTVTDSNGCETSCQIDIAKELYCWINLVQNVSVRGGSDGAARVNGNGGFRPFTYQWEDGSTAQLNSKLGAGTHYVVITDATGATSRCSITITEPTGGNCDSFMATVEQDKLSTDHQTKDGVATVYPKIGTAPFTYLWDNGETTQTATRLTYGLRTVTVTDASGCETSSQIDIAKELYCWINLYGNISVHGGNDGSAMVHGNGGYRPHTFKWDDGSTQQLNTNLGVGTHYVTITDAKGATSQCSITIYQPNEEVCDGVDNDGDGKVDEGFDQDGDGIADCYDQCDDRIDTDGDGIPDCTDECDDRIDTDGDGTPDCIDQCDDSIDTDGDGTPDCIDQCDDAIDTDGDGIPDCTDQCDDTIDTDGDGISDCEDTCDDTIDSDGDGISDCEDTCDDTIDTDGDGIPDCTDQCDDTIDSDGDGISDCEDTCDDTIDSDGDGISDCEDTCDDTIDTDGDGIPDCTDQCDDTIDTDGDGTPDCTDQCDDTIDSDGDGISDCEDTCDDTIDSDGDGISDCEDICPRSDDTMDSDGDGIPDGCDVEECDGVDNNGDGQIDEGLDCNTGGIDQCETAYARSTDENVRTCFIDIPNVSGNRWGWVNEFPSSNGTYQMEVYAAAGQCDISKGALVGNVEVTYTDRSIEVTVTTLPGYKMTEAQLHVGSQILPTQGNGFTTAPGQYPYSDMVDGDFTTYTFESISAGDADTFYVVLHANVCPVVENESLPAKRPVSKLELKAYPVPFKENLNLNIVSPGNTKGSLSLFNGIGQKVKDFGQHSLRKGDNEIYLSIDELPVGTYFIRMNSVYGKETLQVMRK